MTREEIVTAKSIIRSLRGIIKDLCTIRGASYVEDNKMVDIARKLHKVISVINTVQLWYSIQNIPKYDEPIIAKYTFNNSEEYSIDYVTIQTDWLAHCKENNIVSWRYVNEI